ncbi:hypothetical protein HY490_01675 [Candidatus Woesearchaeota archaeon]|nr:hypothetical protein [Candidatus Woesearchaeota archaeon]
MPVFFESKRFSVASSDKPHVSRTDGGHIVIVPKRRLVNRWEMTQEEAVEFIRLSMIVGEAMVKGLNKRGIPVERINFQDNGNWGLDSKEGPHFHLHLYGRAKNSLEQKRGEALRFPDKATKFWEKLDPLNQGDVNEILKQMSLIEKRKKFQLSTSR